MNSNTNDKENNILNEGLTNLGFTLDEAIMESINDSFDAEATHIEIQLFDELVEVQNENRMIKANRYSYIISDNAKGAKNLKEVFDFGNTVGKKYTSIEEYKNKNGIFHYGLISYINVGTEVNFYSKNNKEEIWKVVSLIYNNFDKRGYITEIKDAKPEELNTITARGINLPSESGSIIYVKGVSRKQVDVEKLSNFETSL